MNGSGSAPVRWGFLGAGWIARRALAPAVHAADGAVLQAVAARDPGRAARLGPRGRAYDRYEALLDDPDVDAVYVSLSNEAHLLWTLRAVEAGKHVLCEKPLGTTAAEVSRMAAASASAGRLVVEATFSRWHPRTRRALALVRSGALGEVRSVDAGFTFPTLPAGTYRLEPDRGGGALYDVGPYAVGAALWAVPGVDVVVQGVEVDRHPGGVDLTTRATLALGSVTATVTTSVASPYGEWLTVVGDEATLVLDPPAFTSWLAPSTLQLLGPDPRTLHLAPVDPYQVMVEHVSRAIRGDASAWVLPLEESLRVAQTVDAIRAAT